MAAIFYEGEAQKRAALASKARQESRRGEIRTEIAPLTRFYPAEDYHQKYYLRGSDLIDDVRPAFATDAAFVASTLAARLNGYVGGYGDPAQLEKDLPRWGLSERARQKLWRYVSRR